MSNRGLSKGRLSSTTGPLCRCPLRSGRGACRRSALGATCRVTRGPVSEPTRSERRELYAPLSGSDGPHILNPSTAWYVTDIVASAPPLVAMAAAGLMRGGRRIALKSRTSYGFRDGWAIGFDAEHAIGVWAAGSPSPGRFGHNTAPPLLSAPSPAAAGPRRS